MLSSIILNLDAPEYKDDFHSAGENNEQSELWQQDANIRLVSLLDKMGKEARKYKKEHESRYSQFLGKLHSYHHAIFVSGARGTGKTVFLRNAQAVWSKKEKSQSDSPNLHFIDVIDPTLLNIGDRFSEVIIASVYASVEKVLRRPESDQLHKDHFFETLKKLSSSLGESSELNELRGIDRIQKYRSGIRIERYFHEFLIASVNLLNCDALVLPVDDVDMKIDNAFGVLDDIRCLLSCPLILPLVSGDDELYKHITTMQFENALAAGRTSTRVKNAAEQLSSAYLTKVFPFHDRLPLLPVQQLLPNLVIKYGKQQISYPGYEKLIKSVFYPLCNGNERSTIWPQPDSARTVSQLVRLLPPEELYSGKEKSESLWRNFYVWAEDRRDGVAITNAESYLKIMEMSSASQLDFHNLPAFNPLLQKERYAWADKDFYSQQHAKIRELRAHDTNFEILETVFPQAMVGVPSEENNILRSMPELEFIMEPMFISKTTAENKNGNKELLAIYTHRDYYSQQQNRRYHIFFSRAFELLSWSMLAITNNLPEIFLEEKKFKESFTSLFSKAPFYSIFAVNPTKVITEDSSESGTDDNLVEYDKTVSKFTSDLYEWFNDNRLPSLQGLNLIPLNSMVFNKVFSQLNVLKLNLLDKKKIKDEHLSDLARRFQYIYINALTTFLKEGLIINANVATGARSDVVRKFSEFSKADRTLLRNISGVVSASGNRALTIELLSDSDYAKLIQAMWCNPLFFSSDINEYPIGDTIFEGDASHSLKNDFLSATSFSEIRVLYGMDSGNESIITSEVVEWARDKIDIANIILDKIMSSPKMKSKIKGNNFIARMYNGLTFATEHYR